MNRCSHHRHHTPYPQAAVGTEFPGFDNPTSRPDPECSRQKHLCLRPYSRHAELRNPNYSKQSDLKPTTSNPKCAKSKTAFCPTSVCANSWARCAFREALPLGSRNVDACLRAWKLHLLFQMLTVHRFLGYAPRSTEDACARLYCQLTQSRYRSSDRYYY